MGPDASIQKLPSNVRSLDLTDKNLTFIPIQFSKKSKLTTFILSKNNIHELPKNLKNLKTLVMSYNNIAKINSDMVEGLLSYPCLESLDFSYNLINFFPSQVLNIKTLKTLTLFGNNITSLNCSSESQITFLDLGRNNLKTPPTVPETLQTLILDYNELQDMTKLSNPAKINRLCVSRNKLETFTPSSVLPTLTILDLSNNKLTSLPNFLKVAPHLRQLDASDNFINELPQFPRTLSEIIMRNNRLGSLPTNMSSYPCLIYADFSQNLIEELPVLPRVLQTLIIYDNNIKTAQQSAVAEMFRLYMMNNELEEVPFFKSNALAEYYLSSNKIKQITVKNLSRVTNRIDVSNNLVEELPSDLFVVPKAPNGMKVTHIFAYNNRIKNLPEEFLKSEVIALNISMNPIENLPENLPQTVEQFFVEKCNLKSLPFPDKEHDDVVELMAAYNALSVIPYFGNLIMLNLSHNSLKKLPKLPETIQFLDLSGNLIESLDAMKSDDDEDDDDESDEKSDGKLRLPFLQSFDISFNRLSEWPDSLNLPSLLTLKLRGNAKLRGEFAKMAAQMPSLSYLDATETSIQFTDSSLSSIKHVVLSSDAKIAHVKRPNTNSKVKNSKEDDDDESTEKGKQNESEADKESSNKKSDSESETDKKSDKESNDEDEKTEENNKEESTEEKSEATKDDNDSSDKESDSNNSKKEAPKSDTSQQADKTSDNKKESESEDSYEVDEDGCLISFPSNVFSIPRTPRVSYSTHRHEREVNEDIVIIHLSKSSPQKTVTSPSNKDDDDDDEEEAKEDSESTTATTEDAKERDVLFAALFDSRSSGKVASHCSSALKKLLLSEPLSFTHEFFNKVCSTISDVIHDKSVFDGSSFAVSLIQSNEVLFTTVGDMRIVISKGKKDGFRVVQEKIESGRRFGNKTLGQLSISKIVGDYLVYGVDISPQLCALTLQEDDKFVIVMCAIVYEMLSYEKFDQICSEYDNAVDLADAIKQATIGCMSSDNISVVVIDVSNSSSS